MLFLRRRVEQCREFLVGEAQERGDRVRLERELQCDRVVVQPGLTQP
jgi:hypothetical protein